MQIMEYVHFRDPHSTGGATCLDLLMPLFDAYRQFYRFSADLPGASEFLEERLRREDLRSFWRCERSVQSDLRSSIPAFPPERWREFSC